MYAAHFAAGLAIKSRVPNATTVTVGLDGSGSHVYADGKFAGKTTNCKNNGDGG